MVVPAVLPFVQLLDDHPETLSTLAKEGKRSIGYFCHYTPVELIHAAGFIPIRISGGPGNVEKAYNLAPDFICPYMKRSLEKALAGEYRYLSGVVQGYTCDIACGMANIWANNIEGALFHVLPLPYEDTRESREYLKEEFNLLVNKLSELGAEYSETNLTKSITLYSKIRKYIRDLYQLRLEGKLPLNSKELWQVVQAGYVSVPETYLKMLETLYAEIQKADVSGQDGVPVLVSGSLIETPDILEFIEKSGGRIVTDDLCSGLRPVLASPGSSPVPLEQMIELHFSRFPCPSRSRAEDRLPGIIDLIEQSGAKGVVFLFQKFCTPHLCDYPYLSTQLRVANFPSVMIELDEAWQADAQTGTRLEGLFEIIGD